MKRIIRFLLMLSILASLLPFNMFEAKAQEVFYVDGNGGKTYNEKLDVIQNEVGNNIGHNRYQYWFVKDNAEQTVVGWCLDRGCAVEVSEDYKPSAGETVYAKWGEGVKVTLHAGKGTFEDGSYTKTFCEAKGELFDMFPKPTSWDGDEFYCWAFDPNGNDSLYFAQTVLDKDCDIYAIYKSDYELKEAESKGLVRITYDYRNYNDPNGYKKTYKYIPKGSKIDLSFDEGYAPEGKKLVGWVGNFADFDPLPKDFKYMANSHTTVFACYTIPVILNGNGGYLYGDRSQTILYEKNDDYMRKSSYGFEHDIYNRIIGWYKDPECTIPIEDNYQAKPDEPLYLKWDPKVEISSINFDNYNITIEEGESKILEPILKPSHAPIDDIEWVSGNEQVVTVENGKITGISEGESFINVFTEGYWKNMVNIKVIKPTIKPSKVKFEQSIIGLDVGGADRLVATVEPENAEDKELFWSSSDESIVIVNDEGRIEGLKEGNAIITAKTKNGISASVSVSVTQPVVLVGLDKYEIKLKVGESDKINVKIYPENARNKNYIFSNENPEIASIDGLGNIIAKSAGETTITAWSNDFSGQNAELLSAKCKVIVEEDKVNVRDITINNPKTSLTIGETATNTITVTPTNATNKEVIWSTSDSKVATVDENGKVTAKAVGKATITATAKDGSGKSTSYEVTVKAKEEAKPGCVQGKDNITNFVTRLYELCLNRCPDATGLKYWTDALKSGKQTAAQVAKGFFESNEMKNLKLSDDEFVKRCYRVMMNREADNSGKAYWMDRLAVGMTRLSVVKGFVASNEFTKICQDYKVTKGNIDTVENRDLNYGVTAFITRCFKSVLGRGYDVNGLNYWTGKIMDSANKKEAAADAACSGFFNSTEFKNKGLNDADFIKVCYRTFLDREADAGGLNYWLGRMSEGKEVILKGFANSNEFNTIMARFGIR